MKNRPGLVVGVLAAVLLVLAVAAAWTLALLGWTTLAVLVGAGAGLAVVAITAGHVLAREAAAQVPRPAAPAVVAPQPLPKRGFEVREARARARSPSPTWSRCARAPRPPARR